MTPFASLLYPLSLRRHWLGFMLIVALQLVLQVAIAASPASRSVPVQTMANKVTHNSSSYLEDVIAVIKRNKLSSQLISYANSECQEMLRDSIADKNKTIALMERAYLRNLNETYTTLDRLEEKDERQSRQLKLAEDQANEARKKLMEVEAELRMMHQMAVRQYVNFTLIKEDAWNSIVGSYDNLASNIYHRWGRHARTTMHDVKRRRTQIYRENNSHLQRRTAQLKMKLRIRWSRSTFIRPLLETVWKKLMDAAFDAYRPFQPLAKNVRVVVEDLRVACRLSVISVIEETSKGMLHYLEKDERLKQERAQKKEPPSAQQRIEELKRRNRAGARNHQEFVPRKVQVDTGPSQLNLKAREFFKYILTNKDTMYDDGLAMLPLAVALSMLFRSNIAVGIGCLSLSLGFPSQLIWIITIVAFIRRRNKIDDTPVPPMMTTKTSSEAPPSPSLTHVGDLLQLERLQDFLAKDNTE